MFDYKTLAKQMDAVLEHHVLVELELMGIMYAVTYVYKLEDQYLKVYLGFGYYDEIPNLKDYTNLCDYDVGVSDTIDDYFILRILWATLGKTWQIVPKDEIELPDLLEFLDYEKDIETIGMIYPWLVD